ncbi:hypothetical protein M8C13_08160 [Crossiella sp. SN42]|uniref:hypothetical protein n=1 Tax=Crossiella sp. SN42 TaxID=2944808 RepID=UPI00207CBC59|nr:hypothetical protein [Crossiella sp. SN42]MCO1575732.1 hypothetical protein [Crossiella sp. SN42]
MRATTSLRLALLAAVLATGLLAPAATAAPACTWRASAVPTPAGLDPADFAVTGSDGSGNYSGHYKAGSAEAVFYRWVNGNPVAQPPAATALRLVVDENAAGTVLLQGETGVLFTQTKAGTYHSLAVPAGFTSVTALAINNRGEVLASATRTADNRSVGLLWRSTGTVVVDAPGTSGVRAVDLDDQGAVLLNTTNTAELAALVWRDGDISRNGLRTRLSPRAISGGMAVGVDLSSLEPAGWQWDSEHGNVTYLPRSTWAESINHTQLVGGQADRPDGPPAVWRAESFVTLLPLLPGMTTARVNHVGDDGVVFGRGGGPLRSVRWRCG